MSKESLDWHNKNLVHNNYYLIGLRSRLENLKKEVEWAEKNYDFYKYQISQAVLKGKTSFDRDKFCVKRSK